MGFATGITMVDAKPQVSRSISSLYCGVSGLYLTRAGGLGKMRQNWFAIEERRVLAHLKMDRRGDTLMEELKSWESTVFGLAVFMTELALEP